MRSFYNSWEDFHAWKDACEGFAFTSILLRNAVNLRNPHGAGQSPSGSAEQRYDGYCNVSWLERLVSYERYVCLHP